MKHRTCSTIVFVLLLLIFLGLSACSKHISRRYVCRQDAFQFQPGGTFAMSDVKTGALELKGTYKIKGNRISLIPEKGRTLTGVIKGDSIIVEGLPPLTKEPAQ
jgi:hypothetical protein